MAQENSCPGAGPEPAATLLPAQTAPGREDLVVGQVAPLTGTSAGTGNDYVAGGVAYFAWVNNNGGIYGRKIRVTLKDDSDKPDQTLAVTRQLLADDKPLALAVALTRPA